MKNNISGKLKIVLFKPQISFLILLFLISLALRLFLLRENLFFGPEQGIDFAVIKNIAVNRDLTLIGAKTDINGVFHGPLYYYLAVIPFLISQGNPVCISYFFILINSLTVFIIFYLGKELFNERIGNISALIYTFSYGVIVYSRWLSSHPLSIPLSVLFFIFIIRFINNKKNALFGAAICFGLLGQSEFLNFLFFGVILLLIIINFRKLFIKENKITLIISIALLIFFSTANYIVFDFRNKFLISGSLLRLMSQGTGYYIPLIKSLIDSFRYFVYTYSQSVYPENTLISAAVLIFGLIRLIKDSLNKQKNNNLLIIWLLVPPITLILLRHDILEQFFVALVPAYLLLTAYIADFILKSSKYSGFIFIMIVLSVLGYSWYKNIPTNKNIFFQAPQPGLRYSDQLKVIDYIYNKSGNKKFSFQAYTIPYWMPQAWEYLFWQYAVSRNKMLPQSLNSQQLFVIIQDDLSNAGFQNDWLENTVYKWGKKIDEKRFGILTIQHLNIR